jgi:hypothetical protein
MPFHDVNYSRLGQLTPTVKYAKLSHLVSKLSPVLKPTGRAGWKKPTFLFTIK